MRAFWLSVCLQHDAAPDVLRAGGAPAALPLRFFILQKPGTAPVLPALTRGEVSSTSHVRIGGKADMTHDLEGAVLASSARARARRSCFHRRCSPKPVVRLSVGPPRTEDSTSALLGPRRVPRARQKFIRFRTCALPRLISSDQRASMSARHSKAIRHRHS